MTCSPSERLERSQDEFERRAGEFCTYLRDVRNLSPNTTRAYETDLEAFVEWARRGGVDPFHVSHGQMREWLAELRSAGYATTTQNRHLSAVRSLYKWLVSRDITDEDAAAAVASPKLSKRLPSMLSDSDVRLLLSACSNDPEGMRDRALIELLYASGARISEASALDVRDVDEIGRAHV